MRQARSCFLVNDLTQWVVVQHVEAIAQVFIAAGVEGGSHQFRHSFSVELLKAGAGKNRG